MVLKRKIKVGDEVEAKCNKCKKVTLHTVESMDGEEILKVICKVCGARHKFRPPKGARSKKRSEKKALKKIEENETRWKEFLSEKSEEELKKYDISGVYEEGDLIEHFKFGKGYVLEVMGNKMVVVFKDGERKLVFNIKK